MGNSSTWIATVAGNSSSVTEFGASAYPPPLFFDDKLAKDLDVWEEKCGEKSEVDLEQQDADSVETSAHRTIDPEGSRVACEQVTARPSP